MSTATTPTGDLFDRLADAMPRIAEAVNAFDLKDNQRTALHALLTAAGVQPAISGPIPSVPPLAVVPPLPEEPTEAATDPGEIEGSSDSGAPKRSRSRKPAAKKTFPRIKDINFRPDGKVALRDFYAQKAPSNNHEKNVVFVYYLEQVLEIPKIEVGHVLSAYDEVESKPPSIPDNSLMVTASQKGWLDTADTKAIRTTHRGRNAVEYDMPIKKDKKSA